MSELQAGIVRALAEIVEDGEQRMLADVAADASLQTFETSTGQYRFEACLEGGILVFTSGDLRIEISKPEFAKDSEVVTGAERDGQQLFSGKVRETTSSRMSAITVFVRDLQVEDLLGLGFRLSEPAASLLRYLSPALRSWWSIYPKGDRDHGEKAVPEKI